jgi:hypothetical protein
VGGVVVWLAGHAHLSCLNLRQWITIGVDIHSFIHVHLWDCSRLVLGLRQVLPLLLHLVFFCKGSGAPGGWLQVAVRNCSFCVIGC